MEYEIEVFASVCVHFSHFMYQLYTVCCDSSITCPDLFPVFLSIPVFQRMMGNKMTLIGNNRKQDTQTGHITYRTGCIAKSGYTGQNINVETGHMDHLLLEMPLSIQVSNYGCNDSNLKKYSNS